MIAAYSPAQWVEMKRKLAQISAGAEQGGPSVYDYELCVNEGAQRTDGTFCRDKAEASGWCAACWAEVVPL